MGEAVHMQQLMGVEGVIVDLVKEMSDVVSDMIKPSKGDESNPQFSEKELSFLLKLIPQLIQE